MNVTSEEQSSSFEKCKKIPKIEIIEKF